MAQAVSRRPLTADARVRFQAIPCESFAVDVVVVVWVWVCIRVLLRFSPFPYSSTLWVLNARPVRLYYVAHGPF